MSWLKTLLRFVLSAFVRQGKAEGWIDPRATRHRAERTPPAEGGPPPRPRARDHP